MSSLDELLQPMKKKNFWSECYEKRHIHIQANSPSRFLNLISFEKLDEILGKYGLAVPDITLVNADREIFRSEYLWKNNMVDPARVASLFANGATVIFNSLQDRVESLQDLCREISDELRLKIQTNIYLTPDGSQGFPAHWDTHDVLVLQVEGSKRWRVYRERLELPVEDEKHKFSPGCIDPVDLDEELILRPGDILYIPRGVMHAATTDSGHSLHITLGIIPFTWQDLFKDAIAVVSERDKEWRESVPVLRASCSEIEEEFLNKLSGFRNTLDLDAFLDVHSGVVARSLKPRGSSFLRQSYESSELNKKDRLSAHSNSKPKVIETDDNKSIILSTNFRQITFPIAAKKTIECALNNSGMRLGDFDDGVDWESRKIIVGTLLKEGLVAKLI